MKKLIVFEEDSAANHSLCEKLRSLQYEAIECVSSALLIDLIIENEPDCIILDIKPAHADGAEIIRRIRMRNQNVPVIGITSSFDMELRSRAVYAGADDVILKPVLIEELQLKLVALFRRTGTAEVEQLIIGGTVFTKDDLSVNFNGKKIMLTLREYNIVTKMLANPKRTFTRAQMLEEFWDYGYLAGPRVVDVYITKLRKKFADNPDFDIETIYGLGYRATINAN